MNRIFLILFAVLSLLPMRPAATLAADPKPDAGPGAIAADAELVETRHQIPKLKAPGAYEAQGGVISIELSNYAGYSGLVVANNGLEPNEDSIFTKKYGVRVKLTLSEEESWSALNSGKMAASATTVDVLAAYGNQFAVTVPAMIGYSRGADGIVVRAGVNRINDLKGKLLSTCQFTESDFLIRYLAQEAGLEVNLLDDVNAAPDPAKINLVACADGFGSGDLFLRDLNAGRNRLAGCVTWAPKTGEVVEKSGGKARLLVTNKNLLVVADILVFNKSFARAHPETVAAIVSGLLEGNRQVRADPRAHLPLLSKVFGWDDGQGEAELAKVHLANLPENQAFFDGTIDSAGSYGFIFQSAVGAYGREMIPAAPDADSFVDLRHLRAIQRSGTYRDERASVVPIRAAGAGANVAEDEPLLSKNIRFNFEPNTAKLDEKSRDNAENLQKVARLLQISPGSSILLRGHAEPSLIEKYRKEGGEALVRRVALTAMQLSKDRAAEIGRILTTQYGVDGSRVRSTGRGWEEPISADPAQNRRVEVQWFTVE